MIIRRWRIWMVESDYHGHTRASRTSETFPFGQKAVADARARAMTPKRQRWRFDKRGWWYEVRSEDYEEVGGGC